MLQTTELDSCEVTLVDPARVGEVLARMPDDAQLEYLTQLFKVLSDPTRSRILYALLEAGELCVCDLSAATGTAEATVSQALRLLRASGVVTGRRQGRNVFYRLCDAHIRLLLDLSREHVGHLEQRTQEG